MSASRRSRNSPGAVQGRGGGGSRAVVLQGKTARPGDASAFAGRGALTGAQTLRPELKRLPCPMCHNLVPLKMDGTMRGHQSQRGISCPGVQSGW